MNYRLDDGSLTMAFEKKDIDKSLEKLFHIAPPQTNQLTSLTALRD